MSDTDNQTLVDVFSNRIYKIPYYQRGFSWGEKEVTDFLEDIKFTKSRGVNHYFGNVVLDVDDSSSTKKVKIIDGQQRITTLTILFSNIYWFLSQDIEETNDKKETTLVKCQRMFLDMPSKEINESNIILKAAEQQQDIYEDIILNHPDNRKREPERYSNKRLEEVSEVTWEWIEEISEEESSELEVIDEMYDIVEKLQSDFNLTEYKVSDRTEAGRIFGVLNDRGKSLNIADKVKSTLVYIASTLDKTDTNLVERIHSVFAFVYENVIEDMSEAELNNFMKSHWDIFAGVDSASRNNLHRIIEDSASHLSDSKSEEQKIDWIEGYLDSLENSAVAYNDIHTYEQTRDSIQEEINEINYFLNEISVARFTSIQMAIEICLTQKEKLSCLRELENLSIKIHHINKGGRNVFTGQSNQTAYKMYWVYKRESDNLTASEDVFHTSKTKDYEDKSLGGVVRSLTSDAEEKHMEDTLEFDVREKLESDDVIEGSTVNNWTGINRNILKYILYRIDSANSSPSIWGTGENSVELEHVRPESASEQEDLNYTQKLGNFVILERKLNNECADKDLNKKVKLYSNSRFDMPKEIPNISKTNWTDSNIEDRTQVQIEEILDFFSS